MRLNPVMARSIEFLSQRLVKARKARGLTQGDLARRSGMKQPDISKIERGLIQQTTGIARLAQTLKVPVAWLELGEGPDPFDPTSGFSRSGSPTPSDPVLAHPMSLESMETVPLISWEELMSEDPKGAFEFRAVMPDESMSPRVRAGAMLYFRSGEPPRPGDGVLVRDSTRTVHFREYRAGRPGVWEAHAANPAYQPMESDRDGLTVLGVLTAVGARWG